MLRFENVSKTYAKGKKEALKNINLQIDEGEFVALLGQNGAGKTTLINILAGNVIKSAGKVWVGAYDFDTHELETKHILGIVPQEIAIDMTFTVEDILVKQSGYFGIKNNDEYIDWLLDALALTDKKKAIARSLSGGMKRRLLIAKALIHKPKILILDEPTAGVDIALRHTLYKLLEQLHASGMTIILTTHYIEEAERLCDRIVVIDNGQIVADKPKAELLKDFAHEVNTDIVFAEQLDMDKLDFLAQYKPVITENNTITIKVFSDQLTTVLELIIRNGLKFIDINIEKQKLEDVYLQLVGGK